MLFNTINNIEKSNIIIILIIIGFKVWIFIISIFFNISFVFMYQYDGKMCPIFNTLAGSNYIGTNAPHIKLDPNEITLIIPFIAFLFFIKFAIKKAIVNEQIIKINEFKI